MAMLKRFSLANFRGFQEEQILQFGIPDHETAGSGITYVVGSNNSGKTTVIEALARREGNRIRSSEKQVAAAPKFTLWDINDSIVKQVTLIRPESYTFVENPKLPISEAFEIISARRHWASDASSTVDTMTALANTGTNFIRGRESAETAAILKNIEKNSEKYDAFIELTKEVIPEFSKFAIGFEEQEFIEYISGAGVRHKSDFLGDGVISVVKILSHLFHESEKPLIIDEPELSLHPLAQKRLIKLIGEYARDRQIIISTHSPYFVEWQYIKSGAKLNRVAKYEDKQSTIHTLKEYKSYSSLIGGANWQQPYLADIVAKEIFFQENILFLEGQEDVGLLKEQFEDYDINIFGYGVRGYMLFEFGLQLANDLGIKKACAILDAPTDPAEEPNENTVRQTLEDKFPQYKIVQWNRNDIRDKSSRTTDEKTGYFTKKGKLKEEKELDDFHDKISQVQNYFEPEDIGEPQVEVISPEAVRDTTHVATADKPGTV